MNPNAQPHSSAWVSFTYASFFAAAGLVVAGILFLPLDWWAKGYLGMGVDTVSVKRNYSQYLSTQLNTATSTNSALSANYSMASQLSNLVGSPTAGISAAITAYFTGMQNVANTPNNVSMRQTAISAAQTLASQLNAAGAQYDQMRTSINQ